MNEEESKRKKDTQNVFLIFASTILISVASIAWFMYRMMAKS